MEAPEAVERGWVEGRGLLTCVKWVLVEGRWGRGQIGEVVMG
jgi:hypothetical protein